MSMEHERKGPIMCRKDGVWKLELDKRLKTDNDITLTALGNVKNELLRNLNRRKDIEILEMETLYERFEYCNICIDGVWTLIVSMTK